MPSPCCATGATCHGRASTGIGRLALAAGAHGLTVHPRPDERHTRHSDLPELRALIDDEFPQAEFNIEGYPSEEFLALVEKTPAGPGDAGARRSGAGDFRPWLGFRRQDSAFLTADRQQRLKKGGFRVSLFSDPDPDGVMAARDTGADRIELYTGPYGSCHSDSAKAAKQLERLGKTADAALAAGPAASMPGTTSRWPTCRRWPSAFRPGRSFDRTWLDGGCAGVWHGRQTVRRFLKACGW